MTELSQFHFIRPAWLLALLPLLLISLWMWRRRILSRGWQAVIDKQLLPHLLIGAAGRSSRLPVILFTLGGLLAIIALAGPAWQRLPQPVYKQQSALIIALDLSRSMDAADVKPSRLTRARYKIADLLKLRREGQTALIVYAADAFTVSPLTDDAATIASLLPGLDTEMMPAQGSRADRALQQARQLFVNAGVKRGNILLITDAIASDQLDAFKQSAADGYPVSVIGVGTDAGAPIPAANGGFVKDDSGAIVVARLQTGQLRAAAHAGDGLFHTMTLDDSDIQRIAKLSDNREPDKQLQQAELKTDVWREQGPWLVLLLIPLAALAFRRGVLLMLPLIALPYAPRADALSWDSLWYNADQQGEQLMQQQPKQAAQVFEDPQWKAAAHYRAGEYQQAIDALQNIDTSDADYNRGNALAKIGRLDDAEQAYKSALEKDPKNADAKANLDAIEALKKQQQSSQQKNNDADKSSSNQQQDGSQQQNQQDGSQQQNQQGNTADQKQNDASQSSSENGNQDKQNRQSSQDGQQPDRGQDNNGTDGQVSSNDERDDKQAQSNADQQRNSQDDQSSEQQQAKSQQQRDGEQQEGEQQANARQSNPSDQQADLSQQRVQQWLRKIPDDPSGLLRRKFEYQYKRRQQQSDESRDW